MSTPKRLFAPTPVPTLDPTPEEFLTPTPTPIPTPDPTPDEFLTPTPTPVQE
jgi:hypothetical protein